MSGISGWRCTYGGLRVYRCDNDATLLVKLPSGRIRPRCKDHVGSECVMSEEEAQKYIANRDNMGRSEAAKGK